MKRVLMILAALTLGAFLSVPAKAERLLLQMIGPSTDAGNLADMDAEQGTNLLGPGGLGVDPTEFACFRMKLVNPQTKIEIGEGVDCLRFDNTDNFPIQVGVTAVSFFIMPGGTLVNMGATSLGLFLPGFGDGNVGGDGGGVQVTHMTGSIPGANPDSIVGGTGRFAKASGFARVSGAVNAVLALPHFNCMWDVKLYDRRGGN